MLSQDTRSLVARAGIVVAMAVMLSSMALGQYGGMDTYLNSYFLPADAQISGTSGLIFGVLAPLAIVMVLLNLGLERAMGPRRETKALAILVALFIIPSGGYKTISELLIGFFSIGTAAGGVTGGPLLPAIGPLSGYGIAGIAAVASFIAMAYYFNDSGNGVALSELATAGIGAALIYFVLQGSFSLWSLVGSLVVVGIGWYIFKMGVKSQQFSGYLVSILGFFMMVGGLRSVQGLPGPVRGLLGQAQLLGFAIIIIILLTALGVAAYVWVRVH